MKQIVDLWYDLPQSNQRYQLNPARGLVKSGRSNILSPISDGNGGRVYVLYFDRVGERHMSYQQLIDELFPDGVPEIEIPAPYELLTGNEPDAVNPLPTDTTDSVTGLPKTSVINPADEDTVIINPPTQEKSNGTVAVSDGSAVERNELPIVTDARDDGSQPIDTGSIGETETADQTAQPVEPTEQVTEPANVVEMASTDPVVERPIEPTQLVEPVVPVTDASNADAATTETSSTEVNPVPVDIAESTNDSQTDSELVTDTVNAEQTPETVSEPTPVEPPVDVVGPSTDPLSVNGNDVSTHEVETNAINIDGEVRPPSESDVIPVDPVVEPVSESEPVTEPVDENRVSVEPAQDQTTDTTESAVSNKPIPENVTEPVESVGIIEPAQSDDAGMVLDNSVQSADANVVESVPDVQPEPVSTEPTHQNVLVESESGSADGERTESNAPESPVIDQNSSDDSNIVPTPENAVQTQPDTLNDVPVASVPAEPPIDGVEVVPETPKPTKLTVTDSARLVQERLAAGATVEELAVKFKTTVEKIQKLAAMKL